MPPILFGSQILRYLRFRDVCSLDIAVCDKSLRVNWWVGPPCEGVYKWYAHETCLSGYLTRTDPLKLTTHKQIKWLMSRRVLSRNLEIDCRRLQPGNLQGLFTYYIDGGLDALTICGIFNADVAKNVFPLFKYGAEHVLNSIKKLSIIHPDIPNFLEHLAPAVNQYCQNLIEFRYFHSVEDEPLVQYEPFNAFVKSLFHSNPLLELIHLDQIPINKALIETMLPLRHLRHFLMETQSWEEIDGEGLSCLQPLCQQLFSLAMRNNWNPSALSIQGFLTAPLHTPPSALRKIDLNGSASCDDACVRLIATRCPALEMIDLLTRATSPVSLITDTSIVFLAEQCTHLRIVDVSGHSGITNLSVDALLRHCPRLSLLAVARTGVQTEAVLAQWSHERVDVEIVDTSHKSFQPPKMYLWEEIVQWRADDIMAVRRERLSYLPES